IMEYLVNISKRRAFWSLNEDILKVNDSDNQYAVSIKEDTAYPCLHSPKTTKATSSIWRIQRRPIRRIQDIVCEYSERYQAWSLLQGTPIRRTASGLRPYHFTYPERKLTMKEMLYKFIDEGKHEHAEMRAFISDFQTTNEILFKERNNSLIELRSRWYGPNVDLVKEISKNIGGEFTNLEILKCWSLETSRRLFNTHSCSNKLNMENLPSKYQGSFSF
ncbi:hypothetical protein Tco_1286351, partial [Tanacetum coccineum]